MPGAPAIAIAMASSLLCAMYRSLHLRMISMGISGNQIRDLDKRLANGRPLDLKPDWVVVLIGINDVWRWQFGQPQPAELHVWRSTAPPISVCRICPPHRQRYGTPDALLYGARPNYDPVRAHAWTRYKPDCQGTGGAVRFAPAWTPRSFAWDRLFQHMHPLQHLAWDRIH